MKIAANMGVLIPNAWTTWFVGAVVPSVVSALMIPLLLYKMDTPGDWGGGGGEGGQAGGRQASRQVGLGWDNNMALIGGRGSNGGSCRVSKMSSPRPNVFFFPRPLATLELTSTPEAPEAARARLAIMGPPKSTEIITLATLSAAVVLWINGEKLGISSVATAMMALCSLLITGVLHWKDCLEYTCAWDTLIW